MKCKKCKLEKNVVYRSTKLGDSPNWMCENCMPNKADSQLKNIVNDLVDIGETLNSNEKK